MTATAPQTSSRSNARVTCNTRGLTLTSSRTLGRAIPTRTRDLPYGAHADNTVYRHISRGIDLKGIRTCSPDVTSLRDINRCKVKNALDTCIDQARGTAPVIIAIPKTIGRPRHPRAVTSTSASPQGKIKASIGTSSSEVRPEPDHGKLIKAGGCKLMSSSLYVRVGLIEDPPC